MPKRDDLKHVLVIGQDSSGAQACRVLRAEGLRVSLVNPDPATIMTDPEFADATYIEPITPEFVAKVIARERPDALLATLGGTSALNTAAAMYEQGVLDKYQVELIGADVEALQRAKDRYDVGAEVPRRAVFDSTNGPRWKEFGLQLMRDRTDDVVVVCAVENVDPLGVCTGDSLTVAPAMTLTYREYQHMREMGIAVLREVGVGPGGCDIRFASHRRTGRLVVLEINPGVSRSSALAAKAAGFPIAGIAAKLAIGYSLDEIHSAVAAPRFVTLDMTTSAGEALSLGHDFAEVLGKAMRSMATEQAGFWTVPDPAGVTVESTVDALRTPHHGRLYTVERALRLGASVADAAAASGIDPWFIDQIAKLVELRAELMAAPVLDEPLLRRAKRAGLSDRQVAALRPELAGEDGARALRRRLGVHPAVEPIDTPGRTSVAPERPTVVILGSGPNRVGRGVDFDHSCAHAAMTLRAAGFETVLVSSASTGCDAANRHYVEPLTFEDVLELVHAEHSSGDVAGVIAQLGGPAPLGLASRLAAAGVPVVGTPPDALHLVEDRGALNGWLSAAGLSVPRSDRCLHDAVEIDVDALCDGEEVFVGGVIEHIEETGGSSCTLPPITLGRTDLEAIRRSTDVVAKGIGLRGLLNVRYAIKDDMLSVLAVNPRASSTVPFVSQATGTPLAKAAARIVLGATIGELRAEGLLPADGDGANLPPTAPVAVKEAAHSVMGIDTSFDKAFAKAQTAAHDSLPTTGKVFVSVSSRDKRGVIFPVKHLAELGFEVLATTETAELLRRHGIPCTVSGKPGNGEVLHSVATVARLSAIALGLEAVRRGTLTVRPLQDYHGERNSIGPVNGFARNYEALTMRA